MLKQSYPYALLGLLMVIYYRTDSVMLERILPDGKTQAGIYAQGFRILDAASMLGFLFAGILLPMFAKMIKQNENIWQLFRFSFLLLIIPSIIGAIALNLYRFEVMDLLYKAHAEEAGTIFGILMISFVFVSISIISGTLLTANGNIRKLNIIAIFSVLINIILNLVLIPRYQAMGSAVASMITQFFAALLQMIWLIKIFKYYPRMTTMAQFMLFISVLILIGILVSHLSISWYYGFFIICFAGSLAAFATRLLTFREIRESLL